MANSSMSGIVSSQAVEKNKPQVAVKNCSIIGEFVNQSNDKIFGNTHKPTNNKKKNNKETAEGATKKINRPWLTVKTQTRKNKNKQIIQH